MLLSYGGGSCSVPAAKPHASAAISRSASTSKLPAQVVTIQEALNANSPQRFRPSRSSLMAPRSLSVGHTSSSQRGRKPPERMFEQMGPSVVMGIGAGRARGNTSPIRMFEPAGPNIGMATDRVRLRSAGSVGGNTSPVRTFWVAEPNVGEPLVAKSSDRPLRTSALAAELRESNIGQVDVRDSASSTRNTSPVSFELATNVGQSDPRERSVSADEIVSVKCAALFSSAQLLELERREDILLKKVFGCGKQLERRQDAMIEQECEYSSITDSDKDRFHKSIKHLESMEEQIKTLSDNINLLSTSWEKRFHNITSLSQDADNKLKDIENEIAISRRSSVSLQVGGPAIDNAEQEEELYAHHRYVFNQLTDTFEERFREVERRIEESAGRFNSIDEVLSIEKETREQKYQKFECHFDEISTALIDINSKIKGHDERYQVQQREPIFNGS